MQAEDKPQVFISHSSRDRAFVEGEIIPFLRRHSVEPWYSTDDIPSASYWEQMIRDGLTTSDWFLVVLSPNAIESDWVRTEVQWAMDHRKERFVSVLIDNCDPSALHLQLIRYQHIDFRESRDDARRKLLAVWGKKLEDRFLIQLGIDMAEGSAAPESAAARGTRHILVSEVATIGRASGCELVVVSSLVSRRHAVLRVKESEGERSLWVSDLASTNGVWVNGDRVRESRRLRPGDVLRIGDVDLTVTEINEVGAS